MTCLATAVACGGGAAPELNGLSDQVAQVGTELKIDLNGEDADGDQLSYSYRAVTLTDLGDHAQVTVSPSGAGVFRWTPIADEVGEHAFDFSVSDGDNTTTVTINIDVKSAFGSATAPIFRQPLGTGTTVDMSASECVDISIVIEDQDSPGVTIQQEEPLIEGAELQDSGDGLTATWHWCPTREQAAESRYTVVLSADDGDNPKTLKNYLVVLRGEGGGTGCPGTAPGVSHTATNATTRLDLKPAAQITDDHGLKDAPLFYYSTSQPANPPVLSAMTQLSTTLASGDNQNGSWTATVPNPVATSAMGASATIYYVYVADDDDDTMGSCDHTTQSPVYQMTVTAGGSSVAGLCSPCTADSQCGPSNLCVYMGNMGDSYCLESCAGGCDTGYGCSASPLYSVDGMQAEQCAPQSGSCLAPTGACADDTYEENDTRTVAAANPALTPNSLIDAVSCPSSTSSFASDDDYYKLDVAVDSRVKIEAIGNGESDIDLHIYKGDGTLVSRSTSLLPDEQITKCLKAGTYYTRVNAYGHVRTEYLLSYERSNETCDVACVDDSREDDDTQSQARATTGTSHTSTANQICPNDDDFYKVQLFTGETITMDLTFTQSDTTQDIDLALYKGFTNLWPCSYESPLGCEPEHGQGAVSNEHATYTVPSGCSA
ncbi:MAG: Ig-like domain-containing protein, partial [Deltaproteobacteria bacterium]|nr:Ig-like domain-containing protein [Deltaproteobacteria bacterium]